MNIFGNNIKNYKHIRKKIIYNKKELLKKNDEHIIKLKEIFIKTKLRK